VTSKAGTDPHPEVAELSALSEGLLSPERSAEVRAHLADCVLCADVLESLEEIRGLLGTLPGPQRMPEDIAGRIDAALAAEALLDATLPVASRGTPPHVPRETSRPPVSHAATGPGRRGGGRSAAPGSHPARRTRYRGAGMLAAACAAVALALSGLLYLVTVSGGSSDQADSASMSKAEGGGSTPSVADRVRQLLSRPSQNSSPMLRGRTSDAGPEPASTVPPCVLKGTLRTESPLAADREPYRGLDAYLVVLPHPGSTTLVDAFYISALCTSSAPGTVLFEGTYQR
jgi:anti-sigma factor RsiW